MQFNRSLRLDTTRQRHVVIKGKSGFPYKYFTFLLLFFALFQPITPVGTERPQVALKTKYP